MTVRGDATEFYALAAGFDRAQVRSVAALRDVVRDSATDIRNTWRDNARGIRHAAAYPTSITFQTLITPRGVEVEVGPDNARGPDSQAFLGPVLEFGGTHNAPGLYGQRAVDEHGPAAERRIDTAIGYLFP